MSNRFVFTNFMVGELLDNILAATTEIRIAPSVAARLQLFNPGDNLEARLSLWDGQSDPEIVGCVGNAQTGVLIVNRAQEGTTAQAWPAGTQVRCVLTAAVINQALLASVDTQELLNSNFLPLVGGTMTGMIVLPDQDPTIANHAARKSYVDNVQGNKLPLSGGTMTGSINMNNNRLLALPAPVSSAEPARKTETDAITTAQAAVNADRSGSLVTSGTSAAYTTTSNTGYTSLVDGTTVTIRPHTTNIRAATFALDTTAATAIQAQPGVALPAGFFQQDVPVTLMYSSSYTSWLVVGYVQPAWVTGNVRLTYDDTAQAGWLLIADQTIGNATSGATFADPSAQELYIKIWNKVSNTYAPVSTGRGASGLADWNAGKTLTLAKVLGRVFGVAGAGSGLTSRALGQNTGAETYTFTLANMYPHNHGGGSHAHGYNTPGSVVFNTNETASGVRYTTVDPASTTASGVIINTEGSATPFTIMQPTAFVNAEIKL